MLPFMSLSFLSAPTVFQLMVSMFSNLISGIPNNACPFPGTTKKLHTSHALLGSTVTLHMPNALLLCGYTF